jgi:hypothetical protein
MPTRNGGSLSWFNRRLEAISSVDPEASGF